MRKADMWVVRRVHMADPRKALDTKAWGVPLVGNTVYLVMHGLREVSMSMTPLGEDSRKLAPGTPLDPSLCASSCC